MSQFVSRLLRKAKTQEMIKALREGDYVILKVEGGYKSEEVTKGGIPLFKAMIGLNGYLVRYHIDLFKDGEK